MSFKIKNMANMFDRDTVFSLFIESPCKVVFFSVHSDSGEEINGNVLIQKHNIAYGN